MKNMQNAGSLVILFPKKKGLKFPHQKKQKNMGHLATWLPSQADQPCLAFPSLMTSTPGCEHSVAKDLPLHQASGRFKFPMKKCRKNLCLGKKFDEKLHPRSLTASENP